jgi:mRNA interferase RelE/StbE
VNGYRTELTATALRTLSAIPPRVAEPLVAFIFGSLTENPRRRGKPLQRELAGLWGARRGEFRIIYRLDDEQKVIYVLRVVMRSDAYRGR